MSDTEVVAELAPTVAGLAAAADARAEEDLSGRTLGDRYRLLRRIGGGGMGAVYEAEHLEISRRVAIKVLGRELAAHKEYVARFLVEARASSVVDHESIVAITDVGTDADRPFMVMELLEGEPLSAVIQREGPLGWSRTKLIALQICRALHAAHRAGVVHRDIKPDNCFCTRRAGREVVKLVDFGIAKIFGDERRPAEAITKTGTIFGTPEYMSPEQAQGHATDHRTDIYSTGIVIYELLTGSVPFAGNTVVSVLTKQAMDPPQPPSVRAPTAAITRAHDELVLQALAKAPEQRHQSMRELAEAILAIPEGGAPVSPAEPLRPTPDDRRWRRLALLFAGLCVLLVAALVFMATR